MKSYLSLSNKRNLALPAQFSADDVRYPEELVEHFVQEYTDEGDVILDPFMGFGTTLAVAERMNRIAYGVEFDKNRCSYVQSILKHPERAIQGDSTRLLDLPLPDFDFSITSPPYMGRHHKENPFTAYTVEGSGYEQYLLDIAEIYTAIRSKMKPHARAVIEVSNLKHEDGTLTTLAWDIARSVSTVLHFDGEVIVAWQEGYGYGYDHSYCLLFSKK